MHKTFLQEVAEKLYGQYGNSIEQLTIVLPSRRARLFFSDALSHIACGGTLWQPDYMSMDDIMCEASDYKIGDKIRIISELYKIYRTYHDEKFDKFYFWGEMLLSDFDLLDKYMVDADMLFCNLFELKEIEARFPDTDTFEIVSRFWQHFSQEESLPQHKERFLKIWKTLGSIYQALKKRLAEINFAYQGMVYRSAAENLEQDIVKFRKKRHYIFVGFNALSQCEQKVLRYISKNYECEFFWDYDSYYIDDKRQEAGHFLRQNMALFPSSAGTSHDNFQKEGKQLSAIATASNVIQCKYVNKILRELSPELLFDKDTAIVLTDENLLMPLLHSLPDDKDSNGERKLRLNITMGHPIKHTTAYSFIMRLFDLQHNARTNGDKASFYHVDVVGILNHPFILEQESTVARKLQREILSARLIRVESEFFAKSELLSTIFRPADKWDGLSKYVVDVIYALTLGEDDNTESRTLKLSHLAVLAENIKQLTNSIKSCEIDEDMTTTIFTSLVKRHLQNVRIPYSGEPLQGLQIMGILETRNLDFKNVIILSMTDDNFPGNMLSSSSYIPYNLKAAYAMPTPEHHESVYAYYFYRLVQRAERVDMIYCSLADKSSTGERSRYIHQLEFESPHQIKYYNVGVNVQMGENKEIIIEKTGRVAEVLQEYLDNKEKMLSPSSFSPYTSCPMKFYFSKIAKIKSTDTLSDDVDNPMFGKILHLAMEKLYSNIIGIANPKAELEQMLNDKMVEKVVVEAINTEFFNNPDTDENDYSGSVLLVKNIVVDYIKKSIIPYDIQHNEFTVKDLEKDVQCEVKLSNGHSVQIGGTADRIDILDSGELRVIDYKTGDGHNILNPKKQKIEEQTYGLESLFNNKVGSANYPLQTMLYSMILHRHTGRNVIPALYAVKKMRMDDFTINLIDKMANNKVIDYKSNAEEFEQRLTYALDELFDMDTPFRQCDEDSKACTNCEFKILCKR